MQAIHAALGVEDPVAAVDALVDAGCDLWETQGFILIQLKAIVVLEPEASPLIDAQREGQRDGMRTVAAGLARAGLLAEGWTEARAAATLHALTSVETFLQLRREYGLELDEVKATLRELAGAVQRRAT